MLWMSFPTVAAHASGSGSEFSEDQILFHFERAVGLVPAELEAQIESHRLYLERGGDFLPVCEQPAGSRTDNGNPPVSG